MGWNRMKRRLLCLLFVLAATAASCAPTAWDYCWTQMEPEAFGKPDMWDISGSQELLEFQALLLPDGSRGLIQYGGSYMVYENRTALAAPGDFIDGDYFQNHEWLYDEMFFYDGYEPVQRSVLKNGESTFVAIQTEYYRPYSSSPPDSDFRYGYMELTLDANSDIVVLSAYYESEINQGLYVTGSIPEPTAATLLALGIVALSLRRRSTHMKIAL